MRRLIAALLTLLTGACTGRDPPPAFTHRADTDPLGALADAASARWYHATGLDPIRQVRRVVVGNCERVIGRPADTCYWGCWSAADRTVMLDYHAPASTALTVLTHELGHSLGAKHPDVDGSVMAAHVSDDGRCLNRADVWAVCDAPGVECAYRRPECDH